MAESRMGDSTPPNTTAPASGDAPVRIERHGAASVITLNRPRALNALNGAMRAAIEREVAESATDPMVYALIIRSSSARAFCAGGDLKELAALAHDDPQAACASLRREYELVWRLDRFPKATVALIDGICMGSGAGLSMFNTHRVAGAGFSFAMPEVAVGFFPDVGATRFLSSLPDELGLYLALTGRRIDRADAFALGLVTHAIDAEHHERIIAALAEAEPVDPLLDDLHRPPGESTLLAHRETIRACFSAPSVLEIVERLRSWEGPDKAWTQEVAREMAGKSPTSLAIAFAQMRRGRGLALHEALALEYRVGSRLVRRPDLSEGVRALLIEKDNAPRWSPARLEEIEAATIASFFSPLERQGDELTLTIPEPPTLVDKSLDNS